MIVKISDLLDIYNNEILKGVKNRKKILAFEKCKIEYLVYIKNILENGLYQGGSYNIFLVKEPKIVGDFLVFTVDKSTIQQGNALVAAKNSSGTIVWSWHIWFTDYQLYTITYGDYKFLNLPLGFVNSSDNSGINQPRNIVVSFLQSMGSAKESLTINQSGDANKGGTCTFYQWGRKDPFNGTNSYVPSQTNYYSSILN